MSARTDMLIAAGGGPSAFTDQTISSLSAGQAAGTTAILAANAARKTLMINPPADCQLLIVAAGVTRGYPLFANVPNTLIGPECPQSALYVYGLAATNALTIWEA